MITRDEGSAQGLPPLDIDTMKWTVELHRLQRIEKSLGRKVAGLTQKLEDSGKENSERGDQITSLQSTKEALEKNVYELEGKVQSLEGKVTSLWSEKETLQQDKTVMESDHKNEIESLEEKLENVQIECRSWERSLP